MEGRVPNRQSFRRCLLPDTPNDAPADERLFLDTLILYWKLRIHAGAETGRASVSILAPRQRVSDAI